MKKLFNPIVKAFQNYYESTTFAKRPRSKSRKVRKYANVDISKDFEKRSKHYEIEKNRALQELYKVHGENLLGENGLIKEEMIHNVSTDLIELGPKDDLYSKYLVTGIRKMCILGVIKYRQVNHNLFEDSQLHPETQKKLEELHYLTEHNLPIEKKMLFELVPELFRYEISKLQVQDQALFKLQQKSYLRADGQIIDQDQIDNKRFFAEHYTPTYPQLGNPDDTENIDYQDQEYIRLSKIMQMEHYLIEQTMEMSKLYEDRIEEYVKKNNYATVESYLKQLQVMDTENMLPWERSFMEEFHELKAIKTDVEAMKIKFAESVEYDITPPFWVRNETLRHDITQTLKYIHKYVMIDELDTALIPPTPNEGPDFSERLHIATGGKIDDFIDEERMKYIKDANER